MMHYFGNFGHSAIIIPSAAILISFLFWSNRRADAIALLAALAVCLVATLIAKLAFQACDSAASVFRIESPSGHVSFSAVFYGCLVLIFAAGRPGWQRTCAFFGAALLVLLIGAGRIAVEAHTWPEVVAGAAIGGVSILVFQTLRGPSRLLALPFSAIAFGIPIAAALLVTILLFARHWTPEPFVEAAALRLSLPLELCGARGVDD
jgi:membrane-associated phospholipid phosphatase